MIKMDVSWSTTNINDHENENLHQDSVQALCLEKRVSAFECSVNSQHFASKHGARNIWFGYRRFNEIPVNTISAQASKNDVSLLPSRKGVSVINLGPKTGGKHKANIFATKSHQFFMLRAFTGDQPL